ncbi:hypothetical protein [Planobispora rosea]|nr:hypothetical protein [Planobispora rosea]
MAETAGRWTRRPRGRTAARIVTDATTARITMIQFRPTGSGSPAR